MDSRKRNILIGLIIIAGLICGGIIVKLKNKSSEKNATISSVVQDTPTDILTNTDVLTATDNSGNDELKDLTTKQVEQKFSSSPYTTSTGKKHHKKKKKPSSKPKPKPKPSPTPVLNIPAFQDVVQRTIGKKYRDSIIFSYVPKTDGDKEFFTVSKYDSTRVKIVGNTKSSIGYGLNTYFRTYLHILYNPLFESNVAIPSGKLTIPSTPVTKTSFYKYRYSLNFCTYNYTMSFWGWTKWQEFLDWSWLNGVNLMLDITGQEVIYRDLLQNYGYTKDEANAFVPGPAYFAWFWMQNMSNWNGPLTDRWYNERIKLSNNIHARMGDLGITPVMTAFSGLVPTDFVSKNPGTQVVTQDPWCGYTRPPLLKLTDSSTEPIFRQMASDFFAIQKKYFGQITEYYETDPFHEGGRTGDMPVPDIYKIVQETILSYSDKAIWVMQYWQGNPSSQKLSGLVRKNQSLLLDLNADVNSAQSMFDSVGVPWVWCMINNFGGRMGVDGDIPITAAGPANALTSSDNISGIGIAPEAFTNSSALYDLVFQMAWQDTPMNVNTYLSNYIDYRYGKMPAADKATMSDVWNILLETAYNRKLDPNGQGAPETVINARPSLDFNSASSWGYSKAKYDVDKFLTAESLYDSLYQTYKNNKAFMFDYVEYKAQVIAHKALRTYRSMVDYYTRSDLTNFRTSAAQFLQYFTDSDNILKQEPLFRLDTWLNDAETVLPNATDAEKQFLLVNARALITTWGGVNNQSLKDYSNRRYSGLTSDYYQKRWEIFIKGLDDNLANGTPLPSINWFNDVEWPYVQTGVVNY